MAGSCEQGTDAAMLRPSELTPGFICTYQWLDSGFLHSVPGALVLLVTARENYVVATE